MLSNTCGKRVITLLSSLKRLRFSTINAEHLQTSDRAVAGGVVVQKQDMPRLLAAEIVIVRDHLLDHVAIADLGAHDF